MSVIKLWQIEVASIALQMVLRSGVPTGVPTKRAIATEKQYIAVFTVEETARTFRIKCLINQFGRSVQRVMQMKFDDIYQFFHSPPPLYLSKELAVCYVLSVLARGESYGTELIQLIESEYPAYRLSDTVLYSALKFLEEEQAIAGYWKKVEGRGRPRRMYRIRPDWRDKSHDLARLWHEYANGSTNNSSTPSPHLQQVVSEAVDRS